MTGIQKTQTMEIQNKELKRRIIEISYNHKLSHLGSCLEAVDIIKEIYNTKKSDEKFVLSQGHAGLALYVVLESEFIKQEKQISKTSPTESRTKSYPDTQGYYPLAEHLLKSCGIHPTRGKVQWENQKTFITTDSIDCSTGSLGQGLPIALGMALADRSKDVYCLISDGEMAEGSIYEALRIRKQLGVKNLKVYINNNGYGGYGHAFTPAHLGFLGSILGEVNNTGLIQIIDTNVNYLPFLENLKGHYHVMSESDYLQAMEILK